MGVPANRILIVDDDASIRLLVVTFLTHRGFRLLEAHDGREALAEMHAGNIDLVVMDLMMPGVSGMDVLRERAADPSLQHIPIIVISANDGYRTNADVFDKNVWAVITKPFDLNALLEAVTTCLAPANIPAPSAA
jgi:DNA-binding response OmpR family regulator